MISKPSVVARIQEPCGTWGTRQLPPLLGRAPLAFAAWATCAVACGVLGLMPMPSKAAQANPPVMVQTSQGAFNEPGVVSTRAADATKVDDGFALYAEGRFADAALAFRKVVTAQPYRADAHNNLAVALAALGDYEGARHWLESALRLDPSLVSAHRNLGDTYARLAALSYERAKDADGATKSLAVAPAAAQPEARPPKVTAQALGASRDGMQPTTLQPAPQAAAQTNAAPVDVVGPMLDAALQGPEVASVTQTVSAWAKAWSERNVDAYLAAYETGFRPSNLSHDAWRDQRTKRLQQAQHIAVALDQLRVSLNGDEAYVRFRQQYRSDRHASTDEKALLLRRAEGGRWVIARELRRASTGVATTRSVASVHVKPSATASQAVARLGGVSTAKRLAKLPSAPPDADQVAQHVGDERWVVQTVQAWADSWSRKDLQAHLQTYARQYHPPGTTRAQWVAQRAARVKSAIEPSVTISDLRVVSDRQGAAVAAFKQSVQAGRIHSVEEKVLWLRRGDHGRWQIVHEQSGQIGLAELDAAH